MYLRTTRRKNRDGREVVYYQLAHNVRHPVLRYLSSGQTVAQVIHTFGRKDELDREALVRLCRSIARVCGLKVEDPLGEQAVPASSRGMTVLPEGVTLIGSRRLGLVWLVEALWERLGIGATLRQGLTPSQDAPRFERALLAMTANRLCDPQSKLGVWERWRETVYLPGAEALTKNELYEAMDALQAQATQGEEAIFFRTADLFKLEGDLLFYDTTPCPFAPFATSGDEDDEDDVRCFGRPKDGAWAPQGVVALAVTREGLPVRSGVFPGNTPDVSTVERIKDDLRGGKLGRALFVADAGMHSEANREALARGVGPSIPQDTCSPCR